jgi:hypothetical protein
MALGEFNDKSSSPNGTELAAVLGNSFAVWNTLIGEVSSRYHPLTVDWGFSSPKTGWGLRLKREKRTILYMKPCLGFFLVSFALGEKAVQAAHESGLPAHVLAVIDGAKRYAEGRGVRLEVKDPEALVWVMKLADAKMKS